MIPDLIAESENQVIIVGSNLERTLSTNFLTELAKALDRGVTFFVIVPENTTRTMVGFNRSMRREFGIKAFVDAIKRYHNKTMFIRVASLKGVIPFGIFDQKRVGFSITSSSGR